MLKYFGMTLLAGLLSTALWGQGATYEGMSMYQPKTYDGVEREMLAGDKLVTQRGLLNFDGREKVSFIAENGAQLMIPYKAIKALDFSFYNPIQVPRKETATSRFVPKMHKMGGKRYLTVKYDTAEGLQSTVIAMEPDRYSTVLSTFSTKTGLPINRTGSEEIF
jgi:hypothetical protein